MAVRDKVGGGFRRLPASNETPAFCTENELKCCLGLTLLSEVLAGFWPFF